MSAQPVPRELSDEDLTEDEAAFEAALRGEYVTHEAVKRWLTSKDTPDPLPRPTFLHAALNEGLADAEAGRVRDADEVFDELVGKYEAMPADPQ